MIEQTNVKWRSAGPSLIVQILLFFEEPPDAHEMRETSRQIEDRLCTLWEASSTNCSNCYIRFVDNRTHVH